MNIYRTLLSATSLLVLGSAPQLAQAQCVAAYWDYDVDTVQEEIVAWAFVEDYFNTTYCGLEAYYQWGYWEHSYFASVEIESPTQASAYDDDGLALIPYGGGSAYASASISYVGDPGNYIIEYFVRIFCTVGGYFVDLQEEDSVAVGPVPLRIYLTFDDGPTSCCGAAHNTLKVIDTLGIPSCNVLRSDACGESWR
jgi:hypothetical protein